MKITIELDTIEEAKRLLDVIDATRETDPDMEEQRVRIAGELAANAAITDADLEETRPEELTPAMKAAKTRAVNKAIRLANEAVAKEEAEAEAAANAPVKQDEPLEGELLPAEPEPADSNVIPMTTVEGDADAEALAQAASEQADTVDMDALRDRFHALVQNDWDAAAKILDDLGVDNFTEAMGAGFAPQVAQKMGADAVA